MTSSSVLTTTYYSSQQAGEVRQRLVDVYAEVYEAKAATESFFTVPRFVARLDGHMAHPGWGCVIGEINGECVGYAYGRPDSEAEWREMTTVTTPEVREYGVAGDMFGLCELMVRVPWRGAGVARTVHDVLMEGRSEARASLLVERENTKARALYERWGYRAVATSQPTPDAPLYDAMVLDLRNGA